MKLFCHLLNMMLHFFFLVLSYSFVSKEKALLLVSFLQINFYNRKLYLFYSVLRNVLITFMDTLFKNDLTYILVYNLYLVSEMKVSTSKFWVGGIVGELHSGVLEGHL